MESISVHAPNSKGRPRKRPKRIHADRKYDTPLVKMYLSRRHIYANIPSSRSRKRHVGRPRLFDKEALKKTRYTIERFFGWVKACRRIDARYDRLASSFVGFIQLACILILFNHVLR